MKTLRKHPETAQPWICSLASLCPLGGDRAHAEFPIERQADAWGSSWNSPCNQPGTKTEINQQSLHEAMAGSFQPQSLLFVSVFSRLKPTSIHQPILILSLGVSPVQSQSRSIGHQQSPPTAKPAQPGSVLQDDTIWSPKMGTPK